MQSSYLRVTVSRSKFCLPQIPAWLPISTPSGLCSHVIFSERSSLNTWWQLQTPHGDPYPLCIDCINWQYTILVKIQGQFVSTLPIAGHTTMHKWGRKASSSPSNQSYLPSRRVHQRRCTRLPYQHHLHFPMERSRMEPCCVNHKCCLTESESLILVSLPYFISKDEF